MLPKSITTALAPVLENPYWRESDAEHALSVWAQSGLTLSAFARQCGLSVSRLRRWKRQLEATDGPRFHPVEIVDAREPRVRCGEDSGIEIVLDGGRRLAVRRGFDRALLHELIEVLEGC